jgi:hypothetical protein
VERCISQISAPHAAFTPSLRARPPRFKTLEVTYAFTFVTARQLAHHPEGGFVNELQSIGLPPLCHPSYKVLAFTLVGLSPTERASLRWAHKDVFSTESGQPSSPTQRLTVVTNAQGKCLVKDVFVRALPTWELQYRV